MRLRSLAGAVVPLVLLVSACGGGSSQEATTESAPTTEETQEAAPVQAEAGSDELEPCFRVGEIGSQIMTSWEMVVGSRGASTHTDAIEHLMDNGEDLYDDIRDEGRCAGKQEMANFNYEVAILNMDIRMGDDSEDAYETIAEIGNELLEVSDDEGYEWDYEFVSDASELDY